MEDNKKEPKYKKEMYEFCRPITEEEMQTIVTFPEPIIGPITKEEHDSLNHIRREGRFN